MKFNKIIIAVNLEDETQKALSNIEKMEIDPTTEIHLVHVFPEIFYARGMQFSAMKYPLKEERPRIEEQIIASLKDIKEELLPKHKSVIYKCLFDANPKAGFNAYVEEEGGDLVIVATRGKKGFKTFFDSSFAQHQLKYSPAHVLVLK